MREWVLKNTDVLEEKYDNIINSNTININQEKKIITKKKYTNSSRESLKEQYKEEALKRIKYRLILEEIIKQEKIEVTEEEVNTEIEELAKKYNMTKEEVKKQYGENLDYIKYDLEVSKAFEAIKSDK